MTGSKIRLLLIVPAVFFMMTCEEADTTPPDVSITRPEDGSQVSEVIQIECLASDNEGIEKLELFIDSTKTDQVLSAKPYTFIWNTTLYEDGSSHILSVRATDVNENTSESDPVNVTIDQSEAYPTVINLVSVAYDTSAMTATWEESTDEDFWKYEVYAGLDTNSLELLGTIENRDSTSIELNEFDPFIPNYFRLTVYDTLGLRTTGAYLSNDLQTPPNSVDVIDVSYTLSQMTITWEPYEANLARMGSMINRTGLGKDISDGTDFVSYELLYSETESGERTQIATITHIDSVRYRITDFDPTHENWFWVKVNDFWGQDSLGQGISHERDKIPTRSRMHDPMVENNMPILNWSPNPDSDFSDYQIYSWISGDAQNKTFIYRTEDATDTSLALTMMPVGVRYNYQVICTDHWGQNIASNTKSAFVPHTLTGMVVFNNTYIAGLGQSISQTADGGYIATGYGPRDMPLMKLNEYGEVEWTKLFTGEDLEYGESAIQTSDGGYIIVGRIARKIWVIKTDDRGNVEWRESFGEYGSNHGYEVAETQDGGFIVVGESGYYGEGNDAWLLRLTSGGKLIWNKPVGGSRYDTGRSIALTSDGGFVVAGRYMPDGACSDFWLFKLDESGELLWEQTYGDGSCEEGRSVALCSDGGFILTGTTGSIDDPNSNVWLIKTDSQGVEEWNREIGGSGFDAGNTVQQTPDGGYLIGAKLGGRVAMIRTDPAGAVNWTKKFSMDVEYASTLVDQTADGGYIITGGRYGKIAIAKTDINGDTLEP